MTDNAAVAPFDLMRVEFNHFARSVLPIFEEVSEEDWRKSRKRSDAHPCPVDVVFQRDACGALHILDGVRRFAAVALLRRFDAYRFYLYDGGLPANLHCAPDVAAVFARQGAAAVDVAGLTVLVNFVRDNIDDDGRDDHHRAAGRVVGRLSLKLEGLSESETCDVGSDDLAAIVNFVSAFAYDVSPEVADALSRIRSGTERG